MKEIFKKLAQGIFPSYRVALRNESKLNNTKKELENTKKELTNLKKQINNNFLDLNKKIDNLNSADILSEEEILANIQKEEERQLQEYQKDEEYYRREYDFKFSIVMAVYNVEPFIEEAIDSVINQTIGFEENVQLILVDCCLIDNDFCDKYSKQYPNNIIVIRNETDNIATARNSSLLYIKGKYVNFIDLDELTICYDLSEVYTFFEINYFNLDAILTPTKIFNPATNSYFTDDKLFEKGSRVANLIKEYKIPIKSLSKFFIKSRMLENKSFDNNLIVLDDIKLLLEILMVKQTLGLVCNLSYLQIADTPKTSSLKNVLFNKDFYFSVNAYFLNHLISNNLNDLEEIPHFLQYNLMYNLQTFFKISKIPDNVLDNNEIEKFKSELREILKYIDDKNILNQPKFYNEYKIFVLNFKYGKYADLRVTNNNVELYHENTKILYMSNLVTRIDFITFKDNILEFEGRTACANCTLNENIIVYAIVNGKQYICENVYLNENKYFLTEDELLFRYIGFKLRVPINENIDKYNVEFYYNYRGKNIARKEIRLAKFCPISKNLTNSYYYIDNKVLTISNNIFEFKKCNFKDRLSYENEFLQEIKTLYPDMFLQHAFTRIVSQILRKFIKKEIWLISDRINRADDNGKAFFMYLQKQKPKNIKPYFIIDKNCDDFKVMKKIGKVIPYHSYKKLLYALLASEIVSSDGHDLVYHPHGENLPLYKDLLQRYKYTFLQHGVIRDDLSQWLSKYHKAVKTFVTSSKYEYQSILDYDYYYAKEEVDLTGLPRFDLLYNSSKKYITIMPTWRKHLTSSFNKNTRVWNLNPDFKTSDYFVFYNALLNSPEILKTAKTLGYKIVFMPHPTIVPHINLFDKNDDVDFISFDKPYKEIYAESDLILTDYSSAVCDFSYLRKPIIYAHFDKERFFAGDHVYVPGYFDYETMGFGEVEYDLDSTINRIIEYMENGCQLKDKYRTRIDDFFEFNDKNNCQRVFDAIVEK